MKSNVWSTGVIMPIYKKGDKNKSEDYSKISLTSTLSEMFTCLLTQRLGLSEAQLAYIPGYGTTDAILFWECC